MQVFVRERKTLGVLPANTCRWAAKYTDTSWLFLPVSSADLLLPVGSTLSSKYTWVKSSQKPVCSYWHCLDIKTAEELQTGPLSMTSLTQEYDTDFLLSHPPSPKEMQVLNLRLILSFLLPSIKTGSLMFMPVALGHLDFIENCWKPRHTLFWRLEVYSEEGSLLASSVFELSCRYTLLALIWDETLGQMTFWSRGVLGYCVVLCYYVVL